MSVPYTPLPTFILLTLLLLLTPAFSSECPEKDKAPLNLVLPIRFKKFRIYAKPPKTSQNYNLTKKDGNTFTATGEIGTFKIGRTIYKITQAAIKSPSEHSIMGNAFDAEIQFFASAIKNKVKKGQTESAVLIVLGAQGTANKLLEKIGFG
jgi:carbonic anhydrase